MVVFAFSVEFCDVLFFGTSVLTSSSILISAFSIVSKCERFNSNFSVSFGLVEPSLTAISFLAISAISSRI